MRTTIVRTVCLAMGLSVVSVAIRSAAQTKKPSLQKAPEVDSSGLPKTIRTPSVPKGARQLRPMFLDKKLFTPNKFWEYEEADYDRPFGSSVEQVTTVSLGGRLTPNRGARVSYFAYTYPGVAAAHRAFLSYSASQSPQRNVARKVKSLTVTGGDEGCDIVENVVDDSQKPVRFHRQTFLRYGRYVVEITSSADLRALGPRPAQGERRWMCEPVHDGVFAAATARWARHKALLAHVK